jgi:DNA-directed RNA polymerase subunit N (RpoN/RPB10)
MIIPVRCMACGKVLADKWEAYVARCDEADRADKAQGGKQQQQRTANNEKTQRGIIMDELGLVNICCRIAMQTHVDMTLLI